MCWPGWYGRVSGRSHRTSHLWRLLVSYVLNEQLKRETGAEVISAPVSLVRARPNLARCRMLRLRSGMAGLRLGKFQILAPPRHQCGGRRRVKSSQDTEKASHSHRSEARVVGNTSVGSGICGGEGGTKKNK